MKKYLPYFLLTLPFLFLKLTNLGVRFSDTNIYFYTGYQLLQGKILYKDIFFTNFPLLPYISSFYYLLTGGNIPLFFFTATIEVIATGFILYHIVYKQTKLILPSLLVAALYLYSFIVITTSDHQTGVFIASFFALMAYFFLHKKKLFLSGVAITLALLTKAYFLPIFLAFLFYIFFERFRRTSGESRSNNATIKQFSNGRSRLASWQARTIMFFLGCAVATFLILLPSLILAPSDLFHDVISYSLTRSQGIPKMNIIRFFAIHDVILLLLILWNLISFRKNIFFGLVTLFGVLFLLVYQDIYYLYLNFFIPFLCLSFLSLYQTIQKHFQLQRMVIPTLVLIVLLINVILYTSSYRNLGSVENLDSMQRVIQNERPKALYGSNALTPALAYLTHTPLLLGIVDTNENIFRKGFLDKTKLTQEAIKHKAIIVTTGGSYPEYNVQNLLMGGIIEEEVATKHCSLLLSSPVQLEGPENRINLFRCR